MQIPPTQHSRDKLQRAAFLLTCACTIAPLISIAASHILLGAAIAAILLAREPLRLPPIGLPLFLFVAGTCISLALSPDPWGGRAQIRKFFVFLILVCVATMIRRVEHVRVLALCWAAVAAASALWGFVQLYRRYDEAARHGFEFYRFYIAQRMTGFMSHWMTFGGQLMMVLLLLTAYLLFSPKARHKGWWLACAALIATALVLGLTRGAWLGAATGAIYLLWCWRKKWLLALPLLAVLGFFAAPQSVRERVMSSVRPHGDVDSNQHRIVTWRTGWEMVKAHPWFGLGPEQVGRQFQSYIPADIPRPLPEGWYGHLHNIYLQYAAERGIPTLLMLLWLIAKTLNDFRRAAARAPAGLSDARFILHGSAAAIIAMLVMGFFEHNLGDSEVLQMFLTTIAFGYVAVENVSTLDRA